MGPAIPLVLASSRKDTLFWSGVSGIAMLSCFKHQEPRFLLPAIPLLLASIKWPTRHTRLWLNAWGFFNILAAIVFGQYHQAGVVPMQTFVSSINRGPSNVFWWKTYSPPRWLLGNANTRINTTDLMGMPQERTYQELAAAVNCYNTTEDVEYALLVAPSSYHYSEQPNTQFHLPVTGRSVYLEYLYTNRWHVGLDDLDWAEDGVWGTLERVVGRRGLSVYLVSEDC